MQLPYLKKINLTMLLWCTSILLMSAQPTYIWDYNHFAKMKKDVNYFPNLRKNIISFAEEAINERAVNVANKTNTISGNVHNYESLATYYWKDATNPQGPYIVKDGLSNPECNEYDYPRLQKLAQNLKYLALAFFLTEEVAYLDAYNNQLDTWFINNDTRMLPNMEYAQFAPGHNNNYGMAGGYIEARLLHDVLESLRLVKKMQNIDSSRDKQIRKWMRDFLKWSQTSNMGRNVQKFTNNQAVNYDYVLYDLNLYLGNLSACKEIWGNFFEKRVKPQIQADGQQPQELKRTKPFAYSVFNLRNMTNFCIMAKKSGMNTLQTQQRIEAALRFLVKYIGNENAFPYKDITINFSPLETELKEIIVLMKNNGSTNTFEGIDLKGIYNFGINN